MAHGRPDYWISVASAFASPSPGQYVYRDFEESDIAAGATLDLCAYTVPADRILFVAGIVLYTDSMARNQVRANVDGAWIDNLYFTGYLYIPLNPSALYEILQSKPFYLRIYNYDLYQKHFACTVLGFEEVG